MLVSEPFARRFGARRGIRRDAADARRGPRPFRVAGVYRDYSNDRGTVVLDRELYLSLFRRPAGHEPGRAGAAGRRAGGAAPARSSPAAAGRYALTITTNRELRREVLVIFDRTFAVTRALEAIAVAVAVLGIANALMASAVERRRSFGLCAPSARRASRSAGPRCSRRALTGLTGTAAAVAAGAAFAWLLLAVINPQSFGWTVALAVPGPRSPAPPRSSSLASVLAGHRPRADRRAVDPAAALAGGVRRCRHPSALWRCSSLAPAPARGEPDPVSRATTARIADAALEWWYWTGHLAGRRTAAPYGFQLTFFRLRDFHLAHFAWSDVSAAAASSSRRRRTSRCPGSPGRLGEARRLQRGLDGAGGEGTTQQPLGVRTGATRQGSRR